MEAANNEMIEVALILFVAMFVSLVIAAWINELIRKDQEKRRPPKYLSSFGTWEDANKSRGNGATLERKS